MNIRGLLLLLCWLLTALPLGAEPYDTHRALFELLCPKEIWVTQGDSLSEATWEDAKKSVPAAVWKQLAPLESLSLEARRAAFAGLAQTPKTAPLHLYLRRFYLQQQYGAAKGMQWAGIPTQNQALTYPSFPDNRTDLLLTKGKQIRSTQGQIDYLIVGSGPAGSVLAYELSRAGYRTVLVERGPFVMPGAMDTRLVPELKVGGGAVPTLKSSILVRNGMTVGGGSTVNVDLAFAPTLDFVQEKIEGWRLNGQIGANQWTLPQVEKAYAWVSERMQTRVLQTSEVNANNQILWDGAKACGLAPQLYDLNALPNSDGRRNKRSAVNSLLMEAMTRKLNPLIVIPDLNADKVLTRNKRAFAVEFTKQASWRHPSVLTDPNALELKDGASYQIKARRVILCAGAQGTAGILLRSQLGGPQVGRGVILHPSMPLIGLFERKIAALEGTPSSVYVEDDEDDQGTLYECMSGDPEYVAMMLFGTGDEIGERLKAYNKLGGFGLMLVDSVSPDNRVQIDDDGKVDIVYELSEVDKERLRKAATKSVKMMLAAGAKEVYLPTSELEAAPGTLQVFRQAEDTAEIKNLQFLPARTILTSAHMQSTCKMGQVVNQNHEVRGVKNLFVCDSSIFPTSVGANPMQTIYTVAKLFSEKLIASGS